MNRKPWHSMDLLFPLSVLLVFAISSLTVLLLSARIYQSVTAAAEIQGDTRTAYAYILEKLRQDSGSLQVETLEGVDCLALTREDLDTTTYIYAWEGALRELHVRTGADCPLSQGTEIAPAQDLTIAPQECGLYLLTLTGADGRCMRLHVTERSSP